VKGGKSIPLSLGRRLLIEHCHFSGATQKGVIKRRIAIKPFLAAMAAAKHAGQKPVLPLAFLKAFALAAEHMPELRRSYVKLPWPQFYEQDTSTASMPITRILQGEEIVMMAQFHAPALKPLPQLAEALSHMKTAPLESIKSFERALNMARLPFPLRRLAFWLGLNIGRHRRKFFGTYAVSAIGLAEIVYAIHPLTSLLSYGVIDSVNGEVDISLSFDHRVYDGMTAVRALNAIEAALNGAIATELSGN
jgi:hypothetical protein